MRQTGTGLAGAAIVLAAVLAGGSAHAACQNTGSFDRWLQGFKQEAAASGISQRTIANALNGVTLDPKVIAADRRQGVFAQTFLEFSGRMVNNYRLTHGRRNLKKYGSTFSRIERQYGVPGPVITAFWALETDFGANMGNTSTLRSLATLAYDCRRPEEFRPQLMAALRIVQRGDLTPREMISPWAGELGQTQFLPTVYDQYAVDYDGNGRRDLIRSVPDVLASTANYLKALGWRAGEPWLEEVRVPSNLPWDQADIAIKHPRSQWARWGVTRANGQRLSNDGLPASLLLPMGRNGPAFLAYRNFDTYLEWNQSLVYSTTAAYLATRLAGAPRVHPGGKVASLNVAQVKELQRLLKRAGYDVGGVDGIIGERTRQAVKAVQARLGLPADSYPTAELLSRLR
ncbi:lytic murein transglycosylase [Kaustia mangrovi]|uniref:Lytic murein transglycosylase n=1 Tax=Kaustia mangrovi TaxID=2593653 RepID=A0A7S8C7A8_9HYPH|nr:lytic murein transglycosylase [Kaustia mangrovi]QPC44723.1 lytic murein transglycosylase [Kaustia mangrovi]